MKILLCGDSYGVSSPGSWNRMLHLDHDVTNVCQAGVSEYKILQQVQNYIHINPDIIMVVHTSPYRVHTLDHPVHSQGLHKDCDLIYTDIEYHNALTPSPDLSCVIKYFERHFDPEYYLAVYNLLRAEISRTVNVPTLHVDFFPGNSGLDLSDLPLTYPGQPNHMSESGHKIAYEKISKEINNLELDI